MKRTALILVALVLGGLAIGLTSCSSFGELPHGERLALIEKSPNYSREDRIFVNLDDEPMNTGRSIFGISWRFITGDEVRIPDQDLPQSDKLASHLTSKSEQMRFAWLGHSSILMEMQGSRILLDPVFNAASPFPIGGKRFQPPVLPLDQIPEIDFVVISHDHYDHLDEQVIRELLDRDWPTTFLVPLGVGSHLEFWGVPADRIVELDWWGKVELKGIEFTAAPARHFSGRTLLFQTRKTLWSSWAIKGGDANVFFSGDTGYGTHFKLIGERLGPFDLTFIDGGQYSEDWKFTHGTPEQAVQAHLDLRGDHLMVVHWGMYNLSYHTWYDPVQRTVKAAEAQNVRYLVPQIGSMLTLRDGYSAPKDWWSAMISDE